MNSKVYKGKEGEYLGIDEQNDGYRIGWYFNDDGDFGYYLGDGVDYNGKIMYGVGLDDDCKIIEETALEWIKKTNKDIRQSMTGISGYVFTSKKDAQELIKLLNEALLGISTDKSNWPEWAITASNEGWTPPDGWKPNR